MAGKKTKWDDANLGWYVNQIVLVDYHFAVHKRACSSTCIVSIVCLQDILNKRIKLFSVNQRLTSPSVIMCCNPLLYEGFANVDTRKRMLYRHC